MARCVKINKSYIFLWSIAGCIAGCIAAWCADGGRMSGRWRVGVGSDVGHMSRRWWVGVGSEVGQMVCEKSGRWRTDVV